VDSATVVGLLGALAVVVLAALPGGELVAFIDIPALLIVLGGTAFVVLARFGMDRISGALRVAAMAFAAPPASPSRTIVQLVELLNLARRNGFTALRGQGGKDKFLAGGLLLLADGHDPETVRLTLATERSLAMERHAWGQRIFVALAETAPAMGLIGTLLGLVQMLASLDDPTGIGPGMSVSLLGLLYGVALAQLVFGPIAEKLRLRGAEESLLQALVIDGIGAIQTGQSPRYLQGLLQRYLPEGQRRPYREPASE
jgi:chemotaxis protein MotA